MLFAETIDWGIFWSAVSAVGTFAAVIVALFQQDWARWLNGPRLAFRFSGKGMDLCNYDTKQQKTRMLSLQVGNVGGGIAQQCRVFLVSAIMTKGKWVGKEQWGECTPLQWSSTEDNVSGRDCLPGVWHRVEVIQANDKGDIIILAGARIWVNAMELGSDYVITLLASAIGAKPTLFKIAVTSGESYETLAAASV